MQPVIFVLLALSLVSNATFLNHEDRAVRLRTAHHRLAERSNLTQPAKRCKSRPVPHKIQSETPTPTPSPEPTSTKKSSSTAKSQSKSNSGNSNNNKNNDSSSSFSASGLISASSACGASGATKKITASSGPNGDINFLNCGIQGGGWNPPYISVNQLVIANFESALSDPNTPFKACAPYWDLFRVYANQHGFSPLILASIAMQESTCNPDAVGGGGEQGLMQITKDKCGGAPGGNCRDPDFNIRTGAQFFANTLAGTGGNVVETLGKYNGWYKGLTQEKATAARWSACCRCQNNLDYLHQTFNGWLQNIDGRKAGLGVFFNLAVC